MATIIAAVALGVAATGFVGRRLLIKYVRPGGLKLHYQRSAILRRHKLGLITSEEAQQSLLALKHHYEYEAYKELPIEVEETTTDKPEESEKQGVVYGGGFEPDMTRQEARLVLGLKATEFSDHKAIQKKFRRLMLKNHPDIGGSEYIAAKINEAKEIMMGEKKAAGEQQDEEEEERERKRKEEEEAEAEAAAADGEGGAKKKKKSRKNRGVEGKEEKRAPAVDDPFPNDAPRNSRGIPLWFDWVLPQSQEAPQITHIDWREQRWLQLDLYRRWVRRQQIKRRFGMPDVKDARKDWI